MAGKGTGKVRIIPLGGFDRIGLNMTVVENDDTILVIDCGRSFSEDNLLGIGTSIPNVSYLFKNRKKIKGILLTHGHEDHIGALSYILPKLNVAVYGTQFTLALAQSRMDEICPGSHFRFKAVSTQQTLKLGSMHAEFIHVNHSIPDAAALAIYTSAGIIIHSGDFKIDYSPLFGKTTDIRRLAMLGYKGVLALMTDSTNALVPGVSTSEESVADAVHRIFDQNAQGRIFISTFTSNIDRIHAIMKIAAQHGRKCVLLGEDMQKALRIAGNIGYMKIPEDTVIPVEDISGYPAERIAVIVEDMQGRDRAILQMIADDEYDHIRIQEKDTVILSSVPLPGSERVFSRIVSILEKKGVNVRYENVHASGHACEEELKQLYTLVCPEFVIPAHGEYRYRLANAHIAAKTGIGKENTILLENGDILELEQGRGVIAGKIETEEVLVDGNTVGDTGTEVLRERQQLSENGMIVVEMVFGRSGKLLSEPAFYTRGFVYENESAKLMAEMKESVFITLHGFDDCPYRDYRKIRSAIKRDLSEMLRENTGKSPVILPILTQLDAG